MSGTVFNIKSSDRTTMPNDAKTSNMSLMIRMGGILTPVETVLKFKVSQIENDYCKELGNFNDRARSAKTITYLNVNTTHCKTIEDCSIAANAWRVLEKAFKPNNWAYHLCIYNDFIINTKAPYRLVYWRNLGGLPGYRKSWQNWVMFCLAFRF